jgi:hypothetical protein
MLDVFNTFTQTKANIQYFYQDGVWTKPRGASFIYMLLIGGGGNSAGSNGGGSGAVTRWMGSANNVPDNLVISPSTGSGVNTNVSYRGSSLITLLTASSATTGVAPGANAATPFANTGFFASTGGQNGSTGTIAAANNTFLSGGGGSNTSGAAANYGYITTAASDSYFMTQPIIVGCSSNSTSGVKNGAIGCGAGMPVGSLGGPGLVIIASW